MQFNVRGRLGAMAWANGAEAAKNSKRPRPESGRLPRQLTGDLAAWRRHSIPHDALKNKVATEYSRFNPPVSSKRDEFIGAEIRRGRSFLRLGLSIGNSRAWVPLASMMSCKGEMCLPDAMQQSGPKTAPSEAKRWYFPDERLIKKNLHTAFPLSPSFVSTCSPHSLNCRNVEEVPNRISLMSLVDIKTEVRPLLTAAGP